MLDAPDLMNDYYLNLLHWGANDVIAVALGQSVHLWRSSDGQVETLVTLDGRSEDDESSVDNDNYISSVQWSPNQPSHLAVGTSENIIELWDAERKVKVRDLHGHSARISSMAWNPMYGEVLSTGGRDSKIFNHDVRVRDSVQTTYIGHTQEVCGLSWSPDGTTLASGGNENILCIWDMARSGPLSTHSSSSHRPRCLIDQHIAAVKAIAWCPWKRNILASGGGTADRTIRIWNASNGSNIKQVDTGSQVCAIQWGDHHKELVSSHGFSDNQLILWQYSTMTKIQEFRGHTARVLHLTKSPSGSTLCSASADETIRFWDIFQSATNSSTRSTAPSQTIAASIEMVDPLVSQQSDEVDVGNTQHNSLNQVAQPKRQRSDSTQFDLINYRNNVSNSFKNSQTSILKSSNMSIR